MGKQIDEWNQSEFRSTVAHVKFIGWTEIYCWKEHRKRNTFLLTKKWICNHQNFGRVPKLWVKYRPNETKKLKMTTGECKIFMMRFCWKWFRIMTLLNFVIISAELSVSTTRISYINLVPCHASATDEVPWNNQIFRTNWITNWYSLQIAKPRVLIISCNHTSKMYGRFEVPVTADMKITVFCMYHEVW